MRPLAELLETKRMHYLPMYNVNSVRGLHDMILEIVRPEFVIVEVGSFAGVSSDLFARFCKKLYCVDLWSLETTIGYELMERAELMFDRVWEAHHNIEPIQGRSVEVAKQFKGHSVDMVYIDGNHSYESVKQDIQAWLPIVKRGGWMTGHDMILMSVQSAVKEMFGEVKIYPDTSWAKRIDNQ